MRIAIDIQGIQSEGSRKRGIGRYSLEVVRHIISEHPHDEIILFANASLLDLRTEFKNYLNNKNIVYFEWFAPAPYDYLSMDKSRIKLAILLRSYALNCLHVDLILITSFFEGFSDNCCTDFDLDIIKIPILSIFYDLIPLINPNLYLTNNPDFERFYRSKLKRIKKLDGLLAISSSSAQEAKKFLRFNQNYIFNISSACDRKVFNTTAARVPSDLIQVSKYTPYILYTGANDPRKNVKSLLEAYSQLPPNLSSHKLVLVGKLLRAEIELLDSWIELFKIDRNKIIKTGFLSDDDLVELLKNCDLFVFPSIHEGFGLPVLEAMSCGAPVIGSNCTSIPEVLGLESAMFDPSNVDEIRKLIIKGLTDKDFNEALRCNSIQQSKKFSWSKTAKDAVLACKSIIKARKSKSNLLTWDNFSKIQQNQFNLLISKLREFRIFKRIKSDDYLCQVSACIDKITVQLDSLARYLSIKEGVTSWKIEGPIDSSYSLSILNRCFIKAMNKRINNLSIHITEGPGDYAPNIKFLKQYPDIYSLFLESLRYKKNTDVVSRNLYPPRVNDLKAKYNLIHSYGWEESEFPSDWVNDFNSYLQGVTVMSKQVKKILIDNGVCIPIHVAGLGLDHIDHVELNEISLDARKYKILHISSCFPRKGIDILLKAYEKSFTIKDDITLIIKTFENPHNNVDSLIDSHKNANPLFPHVLLIKNDLSDKEIKALFAQSDMLVAPSRGEGFGLPIGEAMRLGIPVLTTNWGGQTDFCNSENSWLIDYKFVPSRSHFNLDNSYWAEPSIDHLSDLLKTVYNHNPDSIENKINNAIKDVSSSTWDLVAKSNLHFVQNKLPLFNNKAFKLGCITTWNSKCGIASYSKNLLKPFKDDALIFTPYDEDLLSKNEVSIIPSWDRDGDLSKLLSSLISSNITSLIIQFNYGFYDFKSLSNLIISTCKSNINVHIILHSTIDPINYDSKKLLLLVKAFKECQRLLVHTINDLNRLKEIGLVENVSLLPHGIPEYNSSNFSKNYFNLNTSYKESFSIASYGFCLPNKGFKELIMAVDILLKKGLNINLNIYSAIYNEDYQWVFDELIELVDFLNINESVVLNSTYMEEKASFEALSKSDFIVFPYQSSNESSSASVRHGLSTMRPVLVTPLDIFDDVSGLVYRLNGFSPDQIAEGISESIGFYNMSPKQFVATEKKKMELIEKRGFSRVSKRLLNMIKSLEINTS